MSSSDRLIPKGSLILVTGANGFLGSHIVEQFLNQGYKVRGTVRSLDKVSNLKARWNERYPGQFEAVDVPDLSKEGAYDNVLRDVAGFAHTAADVTFTPDYDRVCGGLVRSTLNALRAAASTPSVKSVVITSSYISATMPQIGQDDVHVDEKSWNDQVVGMAKGLPNDHPAKGFAIYMASKYEGEKAAWKFIEEEKPLFRFNTVLPGFCIGEVLDPEKQWGSTGGILRDVFLGKTNEIAKNTPVQAMVSASDVALLHVGAVVLGGTGQRLFGTGHIATWNEILSIFRKRFPEKQFYEDFDDRHKETTVYDDKASLKVLEDLGFDGWKSLEDAIMESVLPVVDQKQ